ncbi:MAG TPA: methyltransferase domain-containing protein [Acidimicrobiales bacterium]|jgi:SAM-dependent methyltransferase|nr:methyltransferase domain-containing protein [Acidimicrobiales bacterium]
MGTPTESFQIPLEAAEVYEARFVPAIFAEWAPRLVERAGIGPGQTVLDVACGTGIVARTAADRVGPGGRVVGCDLNEAMLTVARRVRPDLDWRQGDVGELPFPDGGFDAVLCQMALMFFPDRVRALAEMGRVAAPGAPVAVCVPAGLDDQPAYRALVEVAERHAGPEALALLGTYWACGDLAELTGWFRSAGLEVADTVTRTGVARFASADDLVATEVEGSPLIERITAEVYARIRTDARAALAPFATPDGRLEAPLVCHLVVATTA